MTKLIPIAAVAALSTAAALAQQAPPDPSTLYELSTRANPAKVAAGEPATLVIDVKATPGNHISEEAPLRIELTGVNATPTKALLKLSDSVVKKEPGKQITEVRFEVPYTTAQPGAAKMAGKAVIFVCTETLCLRDAKELSVTFEVTAAAKAPEKAPEKAPAKPAKKKPAQGTSSSKPL